MRGFKLHGISITALALRRRESMINVNNLRNAHGLGTKTVRIVLLTASVLMAVSLTPSAVADTAYTYTGNNYNQLGGTYKSGGPYALSVVFTTTLSGNALDNLPFTDITSTVTSYNFTDGSGLTLNNINNGLAKPDLSVSLATDASGNIVQWFVGAYTSPPNTQMQSNWESPYGFIPGADFSETTPNFAGEYGSVSDDPGTWHGVTVPEPTAVSLLVIAGVGLLARRRQRTSLHCKNF